MRWMDLILLFLLRMNGFFSRILFERIVLWIQENSELVVHDNMQYLGKSFVLLSAMGPFRKGSIVTCFAEEQSFVWIFLPYEWCGVRQLKIDRQTAKIIFREYSKRSA
ncbi:MAG: hypothetical protein CMK59_08170 [Proteobacteria bacterium]|nr:hypothetical protein [Pseudomonadota bacterium]